MAVSVTGSYKGGLVQMIAEAKSEEEKAELRRWFDGMIGDPNDEGLDIEDLCHESGFDLYANPLSEQQKQSIAASRKPK